MSHPLFPDKYGKPGLLTPKAVLKQSGSLDIEVPPTVIFCYAKSAVESLVKEDPQWNIVRWPFAKLYCHPEKPVALMTGFGIGAPPLVMKCEELAVKNVKNFVILGWAGALTANLQVGDVVVCESALRDEGTSVHYLPPSDQVRADSALTDHLRRGLGKGGVSVRSVCSWTTDAPYRETSEEVEFVQSQGASVVDMEMSALLAWAQSQSRAASGLFVISDQVGGQKAPELGSKRVKTQMGTALRAAIAALSN